MTTKINCKVRVLILASVVLFCTQTPLLGQSPEWYSRIKQIKLLETKRSEVEKLLRPVNFKEPFKGAVGTRVDYQVDRNLSVSVLYSNGYCSPSSKYGYDVEKYRDSNRHSAEKAPRNIELWF